MHTCMFLYYQRSNKIFHDCCSIEYWRTKTEHFNAMLIYFPFFHLSFRNDKETQKQCLGKHKNKNNNNFYSNSNCRRKSTSLFVNYFFVHLLLEVIYVNVQNSSNVCTRYYYDDDVHIFIRQINIQFIIITLNTT